MVVRKCNDMELIVAVFALSTIAALVLGGIVLLADTVRSE